MRRARRSGGFFLCLLLNLFLNPEGMIPAAILLVLHFWLGWSFWWAVLALGLWILWITFRKLVLSWANRCGNTPDRPTENKNPYSAGKQANRK